MFQNYWKFQNLNVQTLGILDLDTNGPNHRPVLEIQTFFLSEICTVIHWQDWYEKGNTSQIPLKYVLLGEGFQLPNAFSYTVKSVLLDVYVDDIKVVGKKQNLDWMWEVLNKEVDLWEPTSFFDHENLINSKTMLKKQRYCWRL